MATIVCPHCHAGFSVTPIDRPSTTDSPIGTTQLRAVLDFMRWCGPGRRTNAELWSLYEADRADKNWPALSKNALSRSIRANGSNPWRDGRERGWDIPDIPSDMRPGRPKPSVRARLEREGYQETLIAHSGNRDGVIPPRGAESSIPAYVHPGEETYTADEVRAVAPTLPPAVTKSESGNAIIAKIARERREKAERKRQSELNEMHGVTDINDELPLKVDLV